MPLDDWLDDAPDVDLAPRLTRLAARGELGVVGRWWLDLPALAQPWACASHGCAPRFRAPGQRSCCADLDVAPTAPERDAIAAHLPAVAAELVDDPRWADGAPAWWDGEALTRPGGRCVFALDIADGLSCALHRAEDRGGLPRGAIKPMGCRWFPMAVIALPGDRRLLTAVHRDTARALGLPGARRFSCLGAAPTPIAAACQDTLGELAGPWAAPRIVAAVRRYVRATPSR